MKQRGQKIGFIGAGNMGAALIGAVIGSKLYEPSQVCAFDVDPQRCAAIGEQTGIELLKSSAELFAVCDIVVLAVKPQHMSEVLTAVSQDGRHAKKPRTLVVSIAAGYPIHKIESILYAGLDEGQASRLPIIRVMPNTPALVRAAMSGMSANRFAVAGDLDSTRTLLEAAGRVREFKEDQFDAVTAVSGSGPAYVFYLIEAMIAAGTHIGLTADEAAELTVTTCKGAIRLLEQTAESPRELRRKVTSPGGTTEAALNVLKARKFKASVVEAVAAAAQRADELSRQS